MLVAEIGQAELVVLPYREMHNSGAILVALSLSRPALVPRSPANTALREEVGPGWVIEYDGELDPRGDRRGTPDRAHVAADAAPDLSRRDWKVLGEEHAAAYRRAIEIAQAASMTRTQRRPAEGVEQSLATSASRGAVVMIGGQAVRVIVQLAGVVILARLLGPTDFGLVAMVTAVIGIGEVFRDFGLSSAAVQAKTLSPQPEGQPVLDQHGHRRSC